MKKNMRSGDRIIRIILAVIITILVLTNQVIGLAAVLLGVFAVVFIATSVVGFCPLYAPFKFKTIKKTA